MKNTKIRSWNKFENHFFYFQNGKYFKDSDCKKCVSERICSEFMWSNAEWCTGLHDKNGKEIYEGDIVKWGMHNGSEEHWHRYAVVEINPDIQFRILFYILSETGERKLTDNDVLHYGRFAYKDTENHLEIIGNIYENPELLSGGEK